MTALPPLVLWLLVWLQGLLPGLVAIEAFSDYPRLLDGWGRAGQGYFGVFAMAALVLPPVFVDRLPLRLWLRLSAVCWMLLAWAILENQLTHNQYSGYAAFIVVPSIGLLSLSSLLCAVFASVSLARRGR